VTAVFRGVRLARSSAGWARLGERRGKIPVDRQPKAMVESSGHRSTTAAAAAAVGFFRVPGLFVRLSSKGAATESNAVDPDSVWSPTSPLDLNKNLLRSSPPRVGLGLVDALTADEAGSLHFGGRCSFLDSIKPFLELAVCGKTKKAADGVVAATLDKASEYADCEEYTCVISRGANPRTTHILAGETVEVCEGDVGGRGCRRVVFSIEPFSDQRVPSTSSSPAAPAGVASGRCCCCMSRLLEDRDVFIYL
jgi:hypothetical protein